MNNKYKKSNKRSSLYKVQLESLGVTPSKKRGQNFAVSPYLIGEIIDFGEPKSSENIVELGPGLGALTQGLKNFDNLTLIEIETKFKATLKALYPKAEVIIDDARSFDFSNLENPPFTIFGNLPYSFSTDILMNLVQNSSFISRAVLLFQKEFALRLAANLGTKDYGSLSIFVQNRCKVTLGPEFDGDLFYPPTKVKSQLVELRFRDKTIVTSELLDFFETVVQLSFAQRRKKLINSLSASKIFSQAEIKEALIAASIDKDIRPEQLSIKDYELFVTELHKKVCSN